MRYFVLVAVAVLFISCQDSWSGRPQMKTQIDSISYGIGVDIGKDLKQQSFELNPEVVAHAIHDILTDKEPALTDEQIAELMNALHVKMMEKHQEDVRGMADKNKADGEAFLAENKSKEGVITLPSGLQYKVIKMGGGKKPKATQTVSVHYTGTLIDGTEFDSSQKRGEPVTFEVSSVIKGFAEALQMMPVGSKWILYIPSNLAYGETGAGSIIPPNATLIFELELVSIL